VTTSATAFRHAFSAPLLAAGAVTLAAIIPVQPDSRVFPSLNLGLLIFGLVALLAMLAAAFLSRGAPAASRIAAAALWAGCALALLGAVASIAASAETLDLSNVVLAQKFNGAYLVKQPVAAWIFAVSLALTSDADALFGAWSIPRFIALTMWLCVFSGLGATLFIGGYLGASLEGWAALLLKTLAFAVFVLLLRRTLRRVPPSARLGIAWAAAAVGLLNVIVTLVQQGP
jgi:hypothetical protein